MKKTIIAAIILLTGCSTVEKREDFNFINENLTINSSSENIDNELIKINYNFKNKSFNYPFRMEKFYHVIYILENIHEKKYAEYKITHESKNYTVYIDYKDPKSIEDIIVEINNCFIEKGFPNNEIVISNKKTLSYLKNKNINKIKIDFLIDEKEKSVSLIINENNSDYQDDLKNFK